MSKILITDDSTFARLALRKIVKAEPEWSIIGWQPSGVLAKLK